MDVTKETHGWKVENIQKIIQHIWTATRKKLPTKKRTKCMQQLTNKTQEHSQSLFFVPFKRFDCCKRKENMFFQGHPFFPGFTTAMNK